MAHTNNGLSPMQQALVSGDFAGLRKLGEEKATMIDNRVRSLHSRTCSTWETWREFGIPLMEGGKADFTFDGCRKHGVKLARNR